MSKMPGTEEMPNAEVTKIGELIINEDEARLAALGRKQVLKRNFNIWSLIFMCFCTSVTWEALTSTMTQALVSGGSSSMVFGFLAAAVGSLLIALSISEFASIIPTAGGQYHYVAELSPPKLKRIFSFYSGWLTIWGWVLSTTSGIFAESMQVQAYIILFYPSYVYERWHTSLILMAFATIFALIGTYGIKWLHRLQFLGIILHVSGYLATMIYLLVRVNPKNTAEFVFTDTTNLTGWESPGIAWSIGLLSSALGFVGWDSASHMAEEMQHAARDLPRAMYGCVALTGILTFPWVIALMFCMTDVLSVVTGPVGPLSPLVQLIYNISGGDQGQVVGMTCFFLILSSLVAGPSCMTASSRVIWSFAREGGLPRILSKVDEKKSVPVYAMLATWFCVCALSCIYIGNSTAFYGLASGVTVVLVVSYLLPIILNLVWGLERNNLRPGPFSLGRWARPINIAALAWGIYLCLFLCFPVYQPVTAVNMNYSCVVLAAGFIGPTIAWFTYGRKTYVGVLNEIDSNVAEAVAGILHDQSRDTGDHHHTL